MGASEMVFSPSGSWGEEDEIQAPCPPFNLYRSSAKPDPQPLFGMAE